MDGFGTARAKIPEPSPGAEEKEQKQIISENSETSTPLVPLSIKSAARTIANGLGNLLLVWPPYQHREVYIPKTTVEEDTLADLAAAEREIRLEENAKHLSGA